MSENRILQNLISLNSVFIQNAASGDEENPEAFSYFEKHSRVCLSAPHATKSFSQKQIKLSDLYTGAIVKYIGEENAYSYIVRNKFVPKKELVSDFVLQNNLENHFFLDIHGMKDDNGFDLAVGTGYLEAEKYKTPLEYIKELSEKHGLSYVINHQNYTGKPGFTGRLQEATGKANILQLEFSRRYRDIFEHFENVQKTTLPFISEICEFINRL